MMERYQRGLERMEEAVESITVYKKQVAALLPQKRAAMGMVEELFESVDRQRNNFIAVSTSSKDVFICPNIIVSMVSLIVFFLL